MCLPLCFEFLNLIIMKKILLITSCIAVIAFFAVFATKSYAQAGETCTYNPGGTGWCYPYYVNGLLVGHWCSRDGQIMEIKCVLQ